MSTAAAAARSAFTRRCSPTPCAGSGSIDQYGAYVDRLPGITLATVNLMSLFGLHRRLRGALVGHLATFEMTSSVPNRRYGNGLRRLGFGDLRSPDFYDEHVEADAVHESIASGIWPTLWRASEPALADDILFGARALLALEARWASHLLGAWARGEILACRRRWPTWNRMMTGACHTCCRAHVRAARARRPGADRLPATAGGVGREGDRGRWIAARPCSLRTLGVWHASLATWRPTRRTRRCGQGHWVSSPELIWPTRSAVVIADDDVRYDPRPAHPRRRISCATHDLVRPQNYFSPLPWHAVWDTARTLINRAFGR